MKTTENKMRKTLLVLGLLFCSAVSAETISESTAYLINKYGNSNYSTPKDQTSIGYGISVPRSTNSFNTQHLITPSGGYLITNQGNTTYIIQTSKTK